MELSFEGIQVGLEQGHSGLSFAFRYGKLVIDCDHYSGSIVLSNAATVPVLSRTRTAETDLQSATAETDVADTDIVSATADVQPRQQLSSPAVTSEARSEPRPKRAAAAAASAFMHAAQKSTQKKRRVTPAPALFSRT